MKLIYRNFDRLMVNYAFIQRMIMPETGLYYVIVSKQGDDLTVGGYFQSNYFETIILHSMTGYQIQNDRDTK